MKALVALAAAAVLLPSFASLAQPGPGDQAYAGSKSFCSKRWSGLPSPDRSRFSDEGSFMSLCTLSCVRVPSNDAAQACEARWDRLEKLNASTGWTHRGFIDACSRKCGGLGDNGTTPALAILGVGAAVGVGVAISSGSSKPASP
jgi:hypothetical protein